VLDIPEAIHVLIMGGINDLAMGSPAGDITGALFALAGRAQQHGVQSILGTMTPMMGSVCEMFRAGGIEDVRQAVNQAIIGRRDWPVADFAAALADPDDPARLAAAFDPATACTPEMRALVVGPMGDARGGRPGARPDRPRGLPSPSRAGLAVPRIGAVPCRIPAPPGCGAGSAPAFARHAYGRTLRDRVIRLAINVPSHSESTARLHNVRSLLLCAGTTCFVKAPDSKQPRPLRHNKSSISPQMIGLKRPPTTV
jgi:hypothetical protein